MRCKVIVLHRLEFLYEALRLHSLAFEANARTVSPE